jgi:hypothetical protein
VTTNEKEGYYYQHPVIVFGVRPVVVFCLLHHATGFQQKQWRCNKRGCG